MRKGIVVLVTFLTMIVAPMAYAHEKLEADQLPRVSVQLWSVRDFIEKDYEGTLRKIADMGFQGVEFARYFGPYEGKPKELKALLDELGLVVSGAHVTWEQMNDENIQSTLDMYKILGTDLLAVAWDERAWHPEGIKSLVKQINEIAAKAGAEGFRFGFHNHDQEFNEFQGATYWDYLASNTNHTVLLQLDVGWVNYTKQDPISFVKRYPGRTLTTHIKVRTHESSKQSSILGEDGYDWANLFHVMMHDGGTRWLVVEQEEYPNGMSSMESVAASKKGLDAIIAGLK